MLRSFSMGRVGGVLMTYDLRRPYMPAPPLPSLLGLCEAGALSSETPPRQCTGMSPLPRGIPPRGGKRGGGEEGCMARLAITAPRSFVMTEGG